MKKVYIVNKLGKKYKKINCINIKLIINTLYLYKCFKECSLYIPNTTNHFYILSSNFIHSLMNYLE